MLEADITLGARFSEDSNNGGGSSGGLGECERMLRGCESSLASGSDLGVGSREASGVDAGSGGNRKLCCNIADDLLVLGTRLGWPSLGGRCPGRKGSSWRSGIGSKDGDFGPNSGES